MKVGRPATIGKLILSKALFNRTVADIVRDTGANPHTVRTVLRRASDRGDIVIQRFRQGKSSQAMKVSNGTKCADLRKLWGYHENKNKRTG